MVMRLLRLIISKNCSVRLLPSRSPECRFAATLIPGTSSTFLRRRSSRWRWCARTSGIDIRRIGAICCHRNRLRFCWRARNCGVTFRRRRFGELRLNAKETVSGLAASTARSRMKPCARCWQHFGPDYVHSASALSTYGNCAYRFFAGRVLRLEPRSEAALDLQAIDAGKLLHDILRRFFEQHRKQYLPGQDREALRRQLAEVADQVF